MNHTEAIGKAQEIIRNKDVDGLVDIIMLDYQLTSYDSLKELERIAHRIYTTAISNNTTFENVMKLYLHIKELKTND